MMDILHCIVLEENNVFTWGITMEMFKTPTQSPEYIHIISQNNNFIYMHKFNKPEIRETID